MDPRLVHRWLESVSGRDLESLLALYHPDAVLAASNGLVEGREAIANRLHRYSRKFMGMRFQLVDPPRREAGILTFTTDVSGRAGRWLLRHAWHLEEGRIRRHGVEALPIETVAPTVR